MGFCLGPVFIINFIIIHNDICDDQLIRPECRVPEPVTNKIGANIIITF
jgi:hypothetical protein